MLVPLLVGYFIGDLTNIYEDTLPSTIWGYKPLQLTEKIGMIIIHCGKSIEIILAKQFLML